MQLPKLLRNAFFALVLMSSSVLTSCSSSSTNEIDKDSAALVNNPIDSSALLPAANVHAEAILSGTVADTTLEGKVTFDEVNGKVKMVLTLDVPKMANRSVAVHLHEMGACGNMGKDAHGHWNPTNQQHGKWGSLNFHLGDIGNVTIDANGKGRLEMETNLWTIGGDSTSNILGRSVIVHSGVDDFTSQPTGNAGSRIGCGVIQ